MTKELIDQYGQQICNNSRRTRLKKGNMKKRTWLAVRLLDQVVFNLPRYVGVIAITLFIAGCLKSPAVDRGYTESWDPTISSPIGTLALDPEAYIDVYHPDIGKKFLKNSDKFWIIKIPKLFEGRMEFTPGGSPRILDEYDIDAGVDDAV